MSVVIINPGDLRTAITLQQPTISKDAGAAQKAGYTNATDNPTVLAKWVNAHGDESTLYTVKNVQRATVTIRARTDVQPTWRVLRDTEIWQVISVDAIRGQNRWIELLVERVVGTV